MSLPFLTQWWSSAPGFVPPRTNRGDVTAEGNAQTGTTCRLQLQYMDWVVAEWKDGLVIRFMTVWRHLLRDTRQPLNSSTRITYCIATMNRWMSFDKRITLYVSCPQCGRIGRGDVWSSSLVVYRPFHLWRLSREQSILHQSKLTWSQCAEFSLSVRMSECQWKKHCIHLSVKTNKKILKHGWKRYGRKTLVIRQQYYRRDRRHNRQTEYRL